MYFVLRWSRAGHTGPHLHSRINIVSFGAIIKKYIIWERAVGVAFLFFVDKIFVNNTIQPICIV